MTKSDVEPEATEALKSARQRGRPTQSRVAAIEANILSAARATFLEHGFSGASMDSMAQMAGVSKSTLYARYPDKSSLFEAVAKDRLQLWWHGVPREVLSPEVPVSERLLRRGLTMLRILGMPEVGAFTVLMMREKARFPHLAHSFREEGYDLLVKLIAGDLEAAAELRDWTVTDPSGVARTFVAALQGWHISHSPAFPPTDDDCIAFVSRLVTIFLTGKAGW